MKVISLFSGMESMGLGFQKAGFEIVASNEVDPTICKTLETNFDHDVLCRSAHLISVDDLRKDYGKPDGIIFGFPCVIYSKAADIHSTRVCGKPEKNKRRDYKEFACLGGALFLEAFRIVAELQPRFFCMENVPGILSAKIVREAFNNVPCNENTLGYYYKLFEGILQTQEFGLPQHRPRYFFIGSRKNGCLFIERPIKRRRLMVGDILEKDPHIEIPDYVYKRLAGEYRDKPIITEAGPNAIAPTVVAHYAKDRSTRLIKIDNVIRPYTVREMARLQGIPDDFIIEGSEHYKYLQIGNAVPVNLSYAIAKGIKQLLN